MKYLNLLLCILTLAGCSLTGKPSEPIINSGFTTSSISPSETQDPIKGKPNGFFLTQNNTGELVEVNLGNGVQRIILTGGIIQYADKGSWSNNLNAKNNHILLKKGGLFYIYNTISQNINQTVIQKHEYNISQTKDTETYIFDDIKFKQSITDRSKFIIISCPKTSIKLGGLLNPECKNKDVSMYDSSNNKLDKQDLPIITEGVYDSINQRFYIEKEIGSKLPLIINYMNGKIESFGSGIGGRYVDAGITDGVRLISSEDKKKLIIKGIDFTQKKLEIVDMVNDDNFFATINSGTKDIILTYYVLYLNSKSNEIVMQLTARLNNDQFDDQLVYLKYNPITNKIIDSKRRKNAGLNNFPKIIGDYMITSSHFIKNGITNNKVIIRSLKDLKYNKIIQIN